MTAAQMQKEVLRQVEEMQTLAQRLDHPVFTKVARDSVDKMAKMVELAQELVSFDPDGQVADSVALAVTESAGTIESLRIFLGKLPTVAEGPADPSNVLLLYIEMPGLALGNWGLQFEGILRDRLHRALGAKGLLAERALPVCGIAAEDFFWFCIVVKDQAIAVPALQGELEEMALLPFAQVGHIDGGAFRTLYARGTLRPFEECARRAGEFFKKSGIIAPGTLSNRPKQEGRD